jgi:AraC-like DNA-binding protein
MAEARGLLSYSTLNVTQTAAYLGYSRMHEFSREFSGYFGHTPQSLIKRRSTNPWQ